MNLIWAFLMGKEMKLKIHGMFLMLVVLCGAAAAAEPDCDSDNTGFDVVDVFDPGTDASERQRSLQELTAYAHCPGYGYSLGVLYRHGSDLPGNLVEKDLPRARELLLNSGEEGNLIAYADLAEIALKEKQPREAMKWVQVYLYFVKTRGNFDPDSWSFDRSGYNADLLARAGNAWRKAKPALPRDWIGADLNAYLAGRKQAVTAAIANHDAKAEAANLKPEPSQAELRIKRVHDCQADSKWQGYATYLVEVRPDGEISRVALENFSPEPGIGQDLARCARAYEFHPFEGSEPLVARIPVFFGYTGRNQIKVKRK